MSGALVSLVVTLLLGADPALEWRTTRTEHLDIHWHQGLEGFAAHAATAGEDAVAALSRVFGRPFDGRIQVVAVDDQDTANGLTQTLPYDRVLVFPFPPGSDSDLAHYDDWLRVLLLHEFTHTLQLQHAPGVWGVLHAALGRTFQPGYLHPDWMTEGVATLAEGLLSGRGRVGFGPFEAILRAQALAGRPFTLAQIGTSQVVPPRGGTPYLYGQAFFRWLVGRYGVARLIAFFDGFDRWIVPLFHDVHARRAFDDHTWDQLYDSFLADLKARAAPLRERLETGVALTDDGEYRHHPLQTPRGVVLLRGSGHHEERIVLHGPAGEQPLYACRGGCGRLSLGPEGRIVVFAEAEIHHLVYAFSDLKALDLQTGQVTRLSRGARLHDPEWCSARTAIVAVHTEAGRQRLVTLPLAGGARRDLTPLPGATAFSAPACGPAGEVYAIAHVGGAWDLWRLDGDDPAWTRLTDDEAVERDLRVVPGDEGWLLYSRPDAEGTSRVRLLDPTTGRAAWLTTSRTADTDPWWSAPERRLLFVRQGAEGQDLFQQPIPLDPLARPADSIPIEGRDPRPPPRRPRAALAPGPRGPAPADAPLGRPYSPWPTLRPFAWTPTYAIAGSELAALGVDVSGRDAVDHHAWSLSTDYDLIEGAPSALGAYTWSGWWAALTGTAFGTRAADLAFYNDDLHDWPRWVWGGALETSLGLPSVRDRWAFSLRYGVTFVRRTRGPTGIDWQPDSLEPILPGDDRGAEARLAVSYDSRRGYARSVTSEEGFAAGASLSWRDPWIGERGDRLALLRANVDLPLALPWPRHGVLDLTWRGGIGLPWSGGAIYSLGGSALPGVLQQLVNQEYLGDVGLKGYPAGSQRGRHYQRATATLITPAWHIRRAWGVHPAALTTLHGRAFADVGQAFARSPADASLLASVGAELHLGVALFYDLPFRVIAGFAQGLRAPGGPLWYLYLGR